MSPAGDSFVGYASPAGQVRVIPGPAGGVPSTHILSPTARVPALAADAEGNAIAVWSETAGGNMAAGYDAAPPQITGVTIPAVGRARRPGGRVRVRVRRLGCERELGLRGRRHGAGGVGRARIRAHRNVDVQVTATDGAGASAAATGQVTVTDTRAPVLGRVTMSRKRFRLGRTRTPASSQRKRRAPRGTAFRFELGEAATVRIALQRARKGRRVRGRCRAARRPVPAPPSLHALREEPDRAHAQRSLPAGKASRSRAASGAASCARHVSRDRHGDRLERQRLSSAPGGLQGRALAPPRQAGARTFRVSGRPLLDTKNPGGIGLHSFAANVCKPGRSRRRVLILAPF